MKFGHLLRRSLGPRLSGSELLYDLQITLASLGFDHLPFDRTHLGPPSNVVNVKRQSGAYTLRVIEHGRDLDVSLSYSGLPLAHVECRTHGNRKDMLSVEQIHLRSPDLLSLQELDHVPGTLFGAMNHVFDAHDDPVKGDASPKALLVRLDAAWGHPTRQEPPVSVHAA